MFAPPEFLVARPIEGLLPVEDPREPLRVLIASLARGGAERIVLEWLDAEARRGRAVELAVLHPRKNAWRAPSGVTTLMRNGETPEAFVDSIAARWADVPCAISTHLVDDRLLARLWQRGVATIPTVHNAREGWRNDPASWREEYVPRVVACAEAVRSQVLEANPAVAVASLRHVPCVHRSATDIERRRGLRAAWGIGAQTLLIGMVGAFKPQKDFPRAIEVLAALRASRDAALVILGGVLDKAQLAELERTLDRVIALGLAEHVKLPGFVDPIGPWYAACDVLLSASRYEGVSMAAREALAAGLPVVSLDVGGQAEIAHRRLAIVPPDSSEIVIAGHLATHPVRNHLVAEPLARAPRAWSVACAWHRGAGAELDTLFVTANLNAGGAQRSLVNLATAIADRHRIAVAVCGDSTQGNFARQLSGARVRAFRPGPSPDPFALAESILIEAARTQAGSLCFWNADPRLKLLIAKFAPPALRLVDASPGAYAFEEMERERAFAGAITTSVEAYYQRLDALILKHPARSFPAARAVHVIPNGVAIRAAMPQRPPTPKFLVSGRIAPSKHLETIIAAFARVREALDMAELHIVGQAEPRHARYGAELVAASRSLPVRFRGAAEDLEHLDEGFTGTVVLGTHQGCPNAVLEAMAAGIPVIANASGGTGELVRDRESGWLLAEEPDVEALSRAMVECATHACLGETFAARAVERVRAEFTIDAMAGRYLACFERAA